MKGQRKMVNMLIDSTAFNYAIFSTADVSTVSNLISHFRFIN